MAILSFRNQELETDLSARDLSSITNGLIYGTTPIPDVDINEINNAPSFFYATNNLICLLDNGNPTAEKFGSPEIRVNGFWKMTDTSPDGTEFAKYQRFETPVEVELFTPGRISIKISETDREDVEEAYRSKGLRKPDFGMLVVVLNFINKPGGQKVEYAYLLKYTHNPLFSRVDVFSELARNIRITKNVYRSAPYSAETFFIPKLNSTFVYNFYESEEADFDVYNNRDYKGMPLDEVPKYIRLTWNTPSFDVARFEAENMPNDEIVTLEEPPASLVESNTTESKVVRVGGLILSKITHDVDLARHLRDTLSRAGIQYEDFSSGNPSATPGGTAGGVDVSNDLVRRAEESVRNGNVVTERFLDDFQTYLPSDIEVSFGVRSDYVGYVIEKARLNEAGEFELLDIIAIPGKDTKEYIDWKIAYGEVYRYRIRTVFRFVNKHDLSMFYDTDSSISRRESAQFLDANTLIRPARTFYFDSVYSDPAEVQAIENKRPEAPSNVRIFANSRKKEIFITWNQKNQNRDIVGFNVYRKKINEDFFVRINLETIGIRDNYYFDRDIDVDIDYVYAIESIDFHGNFSPLSTQFYTRIKEVVADQHICEAPQKFYEYEGAEIGAERSREESELTVCKQNFALNINPIFQNTDENDTFVIKVTCLDTGHQKEIKINFRTLTIYHMSGYIPAQQVRPYLVYPGMLGFFDAETLARIVRNL